MERHFCLITNQTRCHLFLWIILLVFIFIWILLYLFIRMSINSNIYSFPNNYCSNRLLLYQRYLVRLYYIHNLYWYMEITYVFSQKCISVSCDSTADQPFVLETIGILVGSKTRWVGCRDNDVSLCLIRDRNPRLYVWNIIYEAGYL